VGASPPTTSVQSGGEAPYDTFKTLVLLDIFPINPKTLVQNTFKTLVLLDIFPINPKTHIQNTRFVGHFSYRPKNTLIIPFKHVQNTRFVGHFSYRPKNSRSKHVQNTRFVGHFSQITQKHPKTRSKRSFCWTFFPRKHPRYTYIIYTLFMQQNMKCI